MRVLTLIIILFSFLQLSAQKSANKNIVIGESFTLHSKILNENREVFISLPPNYDRNIHTYPIILVLDAEYLFEITHSIAKIKASRNEMPESIIVGISNNTGKRYDMALQLSNKEGQKFFGNNGGKAKEYLQFFKEELFPFLENNYRINAHRSIIGMSPTFGPVLEAFWDQPNLFEGYIVLAAELSQFTYSGETVATKLLNSIQDKQHPRASIYVGKASIDLTRRPAEEAESYIEINQLLATQSNTNIRYKIEVLENEDHYGMSISGIKKGLETIYPKEAWNIPYRDFWNADAPANALKAFYDKLSQQYGFEILPVEDAFYASQNLLGSIRRMRRQGRTKEMTDFIKLAAAYYPNSEEIKKLLVDHNIKN